LLFEDWMIDGDDLFNTHTPPPLASRRSSSRARRDGTDHAGFACALARARVCR
jgi:hypothetical protein